MQHKEGCKAMTQPSNTNRPWSHYINNAKEVGLSIFQEKATGESEIRVLLPARTDEGLFSNPIHHRSINAFMRRCTILRAIQNQCPQRGGGTSSPQSLLQWLQHLHPNNERNVIQVYGSIYFFKLVKPKLNVNSNLHQIIMFVQCRLQKITVYINTHHLF